MRQCGRILVDMCLLKQEFINNRHWEFGSPIVSTLLQIKILSKFLVHLMDCLLFEGISLTNEAIFFYLASPQGIHKALCRFGQLIILLMKSPKNLHTKLSPALGWEVGTSVKWSLIRQ